MGRPRIATSKTPTYLVHPPRLSVSNLASINQRLTSLGISSHQPGHLISSASASHLISPGISSHQPWHLISPASASRGLASLGPGFSGSLGGVGSGSLGGVGARSLGGVGSGSLAGVASGSSPSDPRQPRRSLLGAAGRCPQGGCC